jgi:hypothetical protein
MIDVIHASRLARRRQQVTWTDIATRLCAYQVRSVNYGGWKIAVQWKCSTSTAEGAATNWLHNFFGNVISVDLTTSMSRVGCRMPRSMPAGSVRRIPTNKWVTISASSLAPRAPTPTVGMGVSSWQVTASQTDCSNLDVAFSLRSDCVPR